jgi:hypothetical protein
MGIVGDLLLWLKDDKIKNMFVNTFFENFTRNREQGNRSIISNYVFILFFVVRGDACQFPFIWKMFSYQTNVKNSTQWFRNNIVSHF